MFKGKKNKIDSDNNLSRRDFLKNSTLAAAALSLSPSVFSCISSKTVSPETKSVVAVFENLRAITDDLKIDARRVREMIDESIKALTNTKSSSEGWLRIFPNLKENEVVGLKVNSINRKIPAHPEVAYAICDSMADAGINKSNILIWDNGDRFLEAAGYTINTSDKGYKCYGTYHDKSIWLDPDARVYLKSVELERTYSRILSQHIDYLINVPVLKAVENAGVTLSLKNMYGAISILEQAALGIFPLPENIAEIAEKMHAHNANPQIAEVNSGEALMKKTKLVVLDALAGVYDSSREFQEGPQGLSHRIVMSQDRVAADVAGFNMINEKRKEMGIAEISREIAAHIWSAGEMGIGNGDPSKIETRKLSIKA